MHPADTAFASTCLPRDAAPPELIRVLHVINGEHYAGAERVQDGLALRLPELGFAVGFACVKPQRFAAARHAQDSPLVEMPMRGGFDLRAAFRLARLIRRENYALVHTHTPRSVLVGAWAARLAGVPLVHHVHSQTAVEVGSSWGLRLSAWVERMSVRRAISVMAVSPSLRAYLIRSGYRPEQIVLVPNGVAAQDELPPEPRRTGPWTVGVVALFRPRKGLEVLLEALARLKAGGLPVRLRAVGRFETTAYENEVRRRAQQLELAGDVDWVGFRSDVLAELRQMDAFVLPSILCEALPMSILEAMAAGTTVVGSRVEGVTDIIRDGQDGVLVEPGDAADLARALHGVLTDAAAARRLRHAAWRRQAQSFSDRSMAAAVAAVYRRALGAGPGSGQGSVGGGQKLPTTDHRPLTTDHQSPTADHRPPTTADGRCGHV